MLLATAFDRYMALCKPLRHSEILTKKVLLSIVTVVALRASVIITMCPLLVKLHLKHFRTTIIAHSYREHMVVVKLAADSIEPRKHMDCYGFLSAWIQCDLHPVLCLYLPGCFQTAPKRRHGSKHSTPAQPTSLSFSTFFTPFVHRFGFNVGPYVHILLSNLYLLLPPLLNPIVYGVKTKQVREGVLKISAHTSELKLLLHIA